MYASIQCQNPININLYRTLNDCLNQNDSDTISIKACLKSILTLLFTEIKVIDIRQLYERTLLNYIYKHANKILDNVTHDYSTSNANNIGTHT